ncbi:MAG: ABC transporter substrate-binding protein [Reyranellaceae bacterium]
MSGRRATAARLAALGLTVLAGGGLAGPPAAAQGVPLTIAYSETPDWLLFVARDLRLFEKAGLSPTFVGLEAGRPMIEAARSGSVDIASVGSVAFIMGLAQGLDWVMIGINPEGAYSQGLVARKDSGIRSPADLKGRRVGVFKGATAQFGLLMMLRQFGVRPDQLTLVDLTPEAQLQALATRQIDAAMVWEPWLQRMVHGAHARIIETEGNVGIHTNVDCYIVGRAWLRDHRETARRFLRALVMASEVTRKDPKLAARIWAREVGLKETWAEAIYDSVPPPLIEEWTNPRYTYSLVKGAPLYQRLGYLSTYMAEEKLIAEPVDLGDSMDMSVIAEVLGGRRPRP